MYIYIIYDIRSKVIRTFQCFLKRFFFVFIYYMYISLYIFLFILKIKRILVFLTNALIL